MMLKDEAHTIGVTLQYVRPFIDRYYILDTGSTDGTQDVVRKTLEGVEGEIFEEPFIDYGASRNRILDLASQQDPSPVFSLMLSADETMHNAENIRKFCIEKRYETGVGHGAYPIQMNVGSTRFDSLRLIRTDNMWRYKGRVHEVLAPPSGTQKSHSHRVPQAWIKWVATDTERRVRNNTPFSDYYRKTRRPSPRTRAQVSTWHVCMTWLRNMITPMRSTGGASRWVGGRRKCMNPIMASPKTARKVKPNGRSTWKPSLTHINTLPTVPNLYMISPITTSPKSSTISVSMGIVFVFVSSLLPVVVL
jgi:hypothetical protein